MVHTASFDVASGFVILFVKTPMAATVAVLAPLAPTTLGDMTEIEMLLFVVH
jgi:hypothetical protein